jgi:hypothetical protein
MVHVNNACGGASASPLRPNAKSNRADAAQASAPWSCHRLDAGDLRELEDLRREFSALKTEIELAQIRRELTALKAELRFRRLLGSIKAFNPNQPRVPAGVTGGGQWTTEGAAGGSDRVRLAASEKLPLGPRALIKLAVEAARLVIDAYRSEHGLWDLFRERVGTVAYTEIDGEKIFGSNSRLPLYEKIDAIEADRLMARYVETRPEMADRAARRQMPLDAFRHAETNALTRAARKFGGTLSGRTLDVYSDGKLCNNCDEILPFVGTEVGNPTVNFFDPWGKVGTIRDGRWIEKR